MQTNRTIPRPLEKNKGLQTMHTNRIIQTTGRQLDCKQWKQIVLSRPLEENQWIVNSQNKSYYPDHWKNQWIVNSAHKSLDCKQCKQIVLSRPLEEPLDCKQWKQIVLCPDHWKKTKDCKQWKQIVLSRPLEDHWIANSENKSYYSQTTGRTTRGCVSTL